jgi:IclR family pca regulon transcriptional regulator
MPTTSESGLHNSSIVKGLQVLEAFDRGRSPLTLTQLVALTGLEKSAVQRFTATLVRLGYLRKDPVLKAYAPAPRLLHLGTSYLRTSALVERAMPHLLAWSREFGETVNVCELDGQEIVVTYRFGNRQVVSSDIMIGSTMPWYATSVGQAIAAFLPPAKRDLLLAGTRFVRQAQGTITSRTALLERLSAVRRDGFAFAQAESYDEDISMSAPIFGPTGEVVAAASVAVLRTRWTAEEARERWASHVCQLAKSISWTGAAAR